MKKLEVGKLYYWQRIGFLDELKNNSIVCIEDVFYADKKIVGYGYRFLHEHETRFISARVAQSEMKDLNG